MEKRLIAVLSLGLGAALLVIAFLAGRLTSNPRGTAAPAPLVIEREPPRNPAATPPSHDEQSGLAVQPAPPTIRPEAPAVPDRPDRPASADILRTSPSPVEPTAIASYFAKIDAIHVAGTGDPTTIAQGIIGGLERGDTSAIDSLVDGAKLALNQASAVQPPSSCADYHRRLIETLSDAANAMVKMRTAIKASDADGIAALGAQMQATQQKVNDLERIRKQLLSQ